MTPDQLADLLEPITKEGTDVTATAAAALIAAMISGYRHLGEEHQVRLIQLTINESWRMYNAAVERENKMNRAIMAPPSGSVH